jgi:hypothetical protein
MSTKSNFYLPTYTAWKGKTFTQITTTIQKNKGLINASTNLVNLFKSKPLKIYRREIANISMSSTTPCNSKTSLRIDEFNRPNGYLVYQTNNGNGLASTLDDTIPNSMYETAAPQCNLSTSCFNPAKNALRRVRSSGNIKKVALPNHNDTSYYTSNSQYLASRNRTYEQNQFQYSLTRPTNGATYCNPVYKPNNSQFSQQGAVSSSTLIQRKDYDTITKAGAAMRTAFGAATADALAYGVPTPGYTIKDKLGAPVKRTPSFNPYNGIMTPKCVSTIKNSM